MKKILFVTIAVLVLSFGFQGLASAASHQQNPLCDTLKALSGSSAYTSDGYFDAIHLDPFYITELVQFHGWTWVDSAHTLLKPPDGFNQHDPCPPDSSLAIASITVPGAKTNSNGSRAEYVTKRVVSFSFILIVALLMSGIIILKKNNKDETTPQVELI